MKRIFLLLFALCCVCVSCDLNTWPEDKLVPENYFTNPASLKQWLNNCYTQFDTYAIAEMEADDILDNSFTAFFGGTRQAATESWSWSMLRRINYFLENSSMCEDKEAVEYYNALARFHRAWFYFDKVRKYGDVMWYDQVIGSTDEDLLYKPRDSREFVVSKMIEDLDAAADGLGVVKNELSSDVTKWTALALKARVCLFEASFRKYHDLDNYEELYQECADACSEIMASGQFHLYTEGTTPYQDIFAMDPAPACEAILARVYNSNLSLYHSITRDALSTHQGFTQRFMNHYLMKDGTYFSSKSGYDTADFQEIFKNRDPRLSQTVWGPGCVDKAGNSLAEAFNLNAVTGYFPLKFVVNAKQNTNRSEDIMLIRYAEVLLDYAEAKAELGQFTDADAAKSINLLRSRVGMPALKVSTANASPDPLLNKYYPNVAKKNSSNVGLILEIRRERTVELVMEGHRQWDLIRWCEGPAIDNTVNPFYGVYFKSTGRFDLNGDGKLDVEIYENGSTPVGGTSASFKLDEEIYLSNGKSGHVVAFKKNELKFREDRDYLWPIPANQRAISKGKLSQNPNWEDGLSF